MARKLSPNTINKFKKRLINEQERLSSMLEQHKQERENIRLSEASAERSPDPTSADGGSMAFELEKEQLTSMLELHQQERENIRLSEASAERSPDPTSADGGSMAFELEKELTLDENTKHLLNQVEHALVLIKKKKYGNCENCGEPIPVARLEAIPYSTICKNCAELIES